MIPKLNNPELHECYERVLGVGVHGLVGLEVFQIVQLKEYARNETYNIMDRVNTMLIASTEDNYPEEYKNGREVEYWTTKLHIGKPQFVLETVDRYLNEMKMNKNQSQESEGKFADQLASWKYSNPAHNPFDVVFREAWMDGFIEAENENVLGVQKAIHNPAFNDWLTTKFNVELTDENYSTYCTFGNFKKYLGILENDRWLELLKSEELYFKTSMEGFSSYHNGYHFRDKIQFQKEVIDTCQNPNELKDILTEKLRQWKGEKAQWIEYTQLKIAPPSCNNEKLKILLSKAFYDWFKEQTFQPQKPEIKTEQIPQSKSDTNEFCNSMPLNIPEEHFKVFTQGLSKNNKPFLTGEQFNSFIDRAFRGNTGIDKQTINYTTREKLFIVKRFYEFYSMAINEYENSSHCQPKYIKLLTDNFTNWDYQSTKNNFGNKVKRNW